MMKHLLALWVAALLAIGSTGCVTEKSKLAANSSDAAKVTVELALSEWNAYIPLGRPSIAVQLEVREAYKRYQRAQLNLLDVAIRVKSAEASGAVSAESLVSPATELAAASTDLIKLIYNHQKR